MFCTMRLLALLLTAAGFASAQQPTFTVTPDTAGPGMARVVRVTAPNGATVIVGFPMCLFTSVHVGGPGGAAVASNNCPTPTPTSVSPCGIIDAPWSPPAALGPRTYWLRCDWTIGGTPGTSWVDFRIEQPGDPVLTQLNQPELDSTWPLAVSAPALAGAAYVAAASFTTDVGIPSSFGVISVDPDPLFWLSFPAPFPGLFLGFQGALDGNGAASLGVVIPCIPALECNGIHVQVVIVPVSGPVLTNCLDGVMLAT
ncbi:MAG: hypothetical protein CMJ83_08650 [Planctomycetes bacterium]|nr:hypothetical protein [Planctomycetota bacterium]